MSATQPSQLLSSLFAPFDLDRRLTVLHIGPALPETVEFFSRFRCKLFFVDLFSELPLEADEETGLPLEQQIADLLALPPETRFDICLFWDVFNFLDSRAVSALMGALRPHLHSESLAHGFAVYNLKSPQGGKFYGIRECNALNVRNRPSMLPGYAPHPQSKLKTLLNCFNFHRSVLLADGRLELLLRANLTQT
jgi:hypothetical protein